MIESRLADEVTAGDHRLKAVALKSFRHRAAHLWVALDYRNPAHTGPQPSATRWTNTSVDRVTAFATANQSAIVSFAAELPHCLPEGVYRNIFQLRGLISMCLGNFRERDMLYPFIDEPVAR